MVYIKRAHNKHIPVSLNWKRDLPITISLDFLDLAFIEFLSGKFPSLNIFASQVLDSITLP